MINQDRLSKQQLNTSSQVTFNDCQYCADDSDSDSDWGFGGDDDYWDQFDFEWRCWYDHLNYF